MLPVMQLSPYDLGPGKLRQEWFKMFQSKMTKGKPIRRLVFWYGTPEYEFHEAFSFVPVSKICSYEAGVKKGYDIIPVRIQNKLKNNKKLTPRDQQTIKRLEEAKNDLKLPPELRTSWLFDFEETYELFGGNEGDELHTSVNACLEKKITSNRSDVGPVPVHVLSSPKVPDVVSVVVSS